MPREAMITCSNLSSPQWKHIYLKKKNGPQLQELRRFYNTKLFNFNFKLIKMMDSLDWAFYLTWSTSGEFFLNLGLQWGPCDIQNALQLGHCPKLG